jgi:hypothetical protein
MANEYVGLRVEINGQHSDKEWIGLRLNMANSKHVVGYAVQRHYLGENSRSSGRTYYKKRSRIDILFGEFPTKGLSRHFKGYITSHKAGKAKRDGDGPYVDVTYFVIGTSERMQKRHTWTGMSWSSAAKAVAKRHKMKAVVHQTPRLSRPLIQNQSDFKFLTEGAEKTGYRFFVWNGTLYFVNPKKMLNSRLASTPYFEGDSIHDLDVEATEAEDNVYEIYGTAADGSMITATSDNSQEEFWDENDEVAPSTPEYEATVVSDLAEAQAAIEARVLSDKEWVTARAKTDGDARVIPGQVIYLNGDNTAEDHRGLWIVTSVQHFIDIEEGQSPRNYHLEISLGRDRLRAVAIPADTEWIDLSDADETVPWEPSDEWLSGTEDDTTAVAGVWQAEYYGEDDSQVEY